MIKFTKYQFFEGCAVDSEIRAFMFDRGFTYKEILMAEKTSATVFTDQEDLYVFMSFGLELDRGLMLIRIKEWKTNQHNLLKLINYLTTYCQNENNGDAVKMALKLLKQKKAPFTLYG